MSYAGTAVDQACARFTKEWQMLCRRGRQHEGDRGGAVHLSLFSDVAVAGTNPPSNNNKRCADAARSCVGSVRRVV